MFGELFHAVVKFSLLEIYKVSVGGFPFLPPNGFPPATFLSLTPYNPPYPVEKREKTLSFPHYTRNYSSSQINLVEDRSSAHIRAHTCLRTREHTQEANAKHLKSPKRRLSSTHARVQPPTALRKDANVIEFVKPTTKWNKKLNNIPTSAILPAVCSAWLMNTPNR